ncbi:MAG: 6-phosphogluconolactonase [Arenimonas sp.]
MNTSAPAGADSTPIFRPYNDAAQWTAGAVAEIVAGLQASLQRTRRARLLLSGGSTPAPIYRALSGQPLEWANVEIALVDERWLPVHDADSNTQLIRDTLLVDRASAAQFQPMLLSGRSLAETLAAAKQNFLPADVLVLGMGPDGHTASLFPKLQGLSAVIASTAPYLAVDASACAGAGPWAQRISLSPFGLSQATTRMLLIRGEHKRRLLERAMAGTDCAELPIRLVLSAPGPALHIHWCPD